MKRASMKPEMSNNFDKFKRTMKRIGWDAHSMNGNMSSTSSIFLYVYDHETRWTWTCKMDKQIFSQIANDKSTFSKVESVNNVGAIIGFCIQTSELGELEQILAVSIASYIGQTTTYSATQQGTTHCHFCVVNYRSMNKVRPIAMAGNQYEFNSADEFLRSVSNTIAYDIKNHPEWFSATTSGNNQRL